MTEEEYRAELAAINNAHAQNEVARDGFLAVAHIAMFAASISFVGNVAPIKTAVFIPLLLIGWVASVIGLITLTASFSATTKHINQLREAINEEEKPSARFPEMLNSVALWSFPVALSSLFIFVTANVVMPMTKPNPPAHRPEPLEKGIMPPAQAPLRSPEPRVGVMPAPQAPARQPAPTPTPPPPKK